MRDWSSIVDVGIGKEKDRFDMLVLKLEYRVMVPWADTILDLNGAKQNHVLVHLMSN